MDKKLSDFQLYGFLFTGILGSFLHFLYDLTGENKIAALFSAINESTWEHMKLLFFPMVIFALIEYHYIGKDYRSFWCVKLIGIITGLILIPIFFYTIGGVFGKTPDFINIAIFFVSAALAYLFETKLLIKNAVTCKYSTPAKLTLLLIAAAFWAFTFLPPELPIFAAPAS